MSESLNTKLTRWAFNFFPATRRTGMKLKYISSDWLNIKIKLPFNWKTKNYHGTMFGGSMFGAIDPVYLVMLTKILGKSYMVWDKSALIRYKKPAKTALFANFVLDQEEINSILQVLQSKNKVERVYHIDLTDREGTIYASIEKTLHIRHAVRQ